MRKKTVAVTGREMAARALALMGCTESNGDPRQTDRLMRQALPLINAVYSDLWRLTRQDPFLPLTALDECIALPERALNDVMPYGLAGFFANAEGDPLEQSLWTKIYNGKRAGLGGCEERLDRLPRGAWL